MNEYELLKRFRDDVPGPSTDAWLRARAVIAAARSEVDPARVAEPVDPPVARTDVPASRWHVRLFRHATARWTIAGLAGALAAVGALAGVGALSDPIAVGAQTVVSRTTSALARASATDLAYAHTVETNRAGAVVSLSDSWTYGGSATGRVEQLDADGSPATDVSWKSSRNTTTGRFVDYAKQTWYSTESQGPSSPLVSSPFPPRALNLELALGTVIRHQLADGNSGAVETTSLNGQPALEISRTVIMFDGAAPATGVSGPAGPSGTSGDETQGPSGGATTALSQSRDASAGVRPVGKAIRTVWTLWVNPTTYLPMQMLEAFPGGATSESSIEWLAPSSGNLAQLAAPIPADFTQVPPPTPAKVP